MSIQGLILKGKVINGDNDAQISLAIKQILTQKWAMISESKQAMHNIYFLSSHYYVHIIYRYNKIWDCIY